MFSPRKQTTVAEPVGFEGSFFWCFLAMPLSAREEARRKAKDREYTCLVLLAYCVPLFMGIGFMTFGCDPSMPGTCAAHHLIRVELDMNSTSTDNSRLRFEIADNVSCATCACEGCCPNATFEETCSQISRIFIDNCLLSMYDTDRMKVYPTHDAAVLDASQLASGEHFFFHGPLVGSACREVAPSYASKTQVGIVFLSVFSFMVIGTLFMYIHHVRSQVSIVVPHESA